MIPGSALRAAEPLVARSLRTLGLGGAAGLGHLSAASGLVGVGRHLYVVADDEHHLGVFERAGSGPGRLVRLFDGDLPRRRKDHKDHKDRKAAKPDLEALLELPPGPGRPQGALLALGSGSRPQRRRGVLLGLGTDGGLDGSRRLVDLEPLYAGLTPHIDKLNIEGAVIGGAMLCLLQRGGAESANTCVRYAWSDVARWLDAGGPAPRARVVERYALGAIDGVPLGFTDGAALPDGGFVFCAAAEDTGNAYDDGGCMGSAIGVVDPQGRLAWMALLEPVCKVEGIALAAAGAGRELLLVSDADDRDSPALLLSASLPESALRPFV